MFKNLDRRAIIKNIISWAIWITSCIAVALFINNAIIVNAMVISGSMEGTIMTGDRVLGSRLNYIFQEPQRQDVIVFLWPDDPEHMPFVKRVIGLPGEKVEIVGGRVYIDDELLDESLYIEHGLIENCGPYYVPEGAYFVLGDNRRNSEDSRDWIERFVPEEYIIGKVSFRIFPSFGRIR